MSRVDHIPGRFCKSGPMRNISANCPPSPPSPGPEQEVQTVRRHNGTVLGTASAAPSHASWMGSLANSHAQKPSSKAAAACKRTIGYYRPADSNHAAPCNCTSLHADVASTMPAGRARAITTTGRARAITTTAHCNLGLNAMQSRPRRM